jgi:DNA repair protein RadC
VTPPTDSVNRLTITDLPQAERPRERLLSSGAASLSTVELLAILLRTGNADENAVRLAERILTYFGDLGRLSAATPQELRRFKGLGDAKTAQLLAAIEIGRRIATRAGSERPLVESASDAARLVADMGELPQEQVRVILLDAARRVVTIATVYVGTLNATVLRVSEIFREAVSRSAAAIIVAHNHPSGDPRPSPEDVEITRALVEAGTLLDIQMVDHIIVARHQWRSMRDLGLGFPDRR